MLKSLIDWYMQRLDSGGYPLIGLLMAVESSLVPLPSELVIPPAAMMAHNTGRFSMTGIVVAGALGSWVGASLMYWAARWAGRPLVLRYGRFLLISREKVVAAEGWASRFGSFGVVISRLLPVVRHLIGIPAGIVKLDFTLYSIYTLAGSALWTAVLCKVGVAAGQDEKLMKGELHRVTLWAAAFLLILGGLYFGLVRPYMKRPGAAPKS